jgi:hypothetical protein
MGEFTERPPREERLRLYPGTFRIISDQMEEAKLTVAGHVTAGIGRHHAAAQTRVRSLGTGVVIPY